MLKRLLKFLPILVVLSLVRQLMSKANGRRIGVLLLILTLCAIFLPQQEIVYASTLTLVPNDVGDYTNIPGMYPAGGSHWDKVDDPPGSPDGDATYIFLLGAQLKDAYKLTDTSQTGTINSVRVYFRFRINNVFGTAYSQPFLRLGTAETAGTEVSSTTTSYVTYSEILARPGGGSWSWTDINNLQVCIGLRTSVYYNIFTQEYIEVDYTSGPTAPTVTTSAATNIADTTVTLNGNITATGGENPNVYFSWGDNDGGTNPATWDNSHLADTPAQPQGTGVCSYNVTGLSPNTLYYFTVNATNSGGTGWGTTLNFTTTYTLSISLDHNSFSFGIMQASTNLTTGLTNYTVTNDGNVIEDITIHGHDLTGVGKTWTLSDDGGVGSSIYGLWAGLSGQSYNITVRKNTVYNYLVTSLGVSGAQEFGLQICSPSSNIGNVEMSGTVVLTASLHI